MPDRKPIPGKFVWFEHVSNDARRVQRFYGEVFGWKVAAYPIGPATYDTIVAGDKLATMIGGYAAPVSPGQRAHWISYVSVEDVDRTAEIAAANGGKVVQAPFDIPTAGRTARIADPQGAELCLFKSDAGDPPDDEEAQGSVFCWNELHTSGLASALGFYEKVLGFSHRPLQVSPSFTYHILSKGGVDRGGAMTDDEAPEGVPARWLPYVSVGDADATVDRARRLGANVHVDPADIPDVGRFAVFQDPAGAFLAVLKPLPKR
jgi:predicted enzyme related to lactoylglutathione lyase